LQPSRDSLVVAGAELLTWLQQVNSQFAKECLPSYYSSFEEFFADAPTGIWEEIGSHTFEELMEEQSDGESIFDRISKSVSALDVKARGAILVSLVEAHMFRYPDSPFARELGKVLNLNLSGLS
jgi:hypothetical protein